ncbi:phosphotransferase family protein [Actinoplanes sp. NPDC048988]|uniref:phosphotransferase family protein n=1 Tax=Actinoplanes sp. NPDC048988 TaxID=3363901 RepID=UPI0037204E5F
MTWLSAPTEPALRAALRRVAPELADGPIVLRGVEPDAGPQWRAATAVVDGRYVVKFAWAEPPARRLRHEIRVIAALRAAAPEVPLPAVAATSQDPVLLITHRADAVPFFQFRSPAAAAELAAALAALHHPRVLAALRPLPPSTPPTTTDTLRAGLDSWIRADQRDLVRAWCDRADRILATPGRQVVVHGDLHGDNHLWDPVSSRLRLVVDWETAGLGEPEFDLRCLPGDAGVDLFTATVAAYQRIAGTALDVDRILAWHVRTVLGDARWRAEAQVTLPGGRTPEQWVDDLHARLTAPSLGSAPW